jgi:hypothetical protein
MFTHSSQNLTRIRGLVSERKEVDGQYHSVKHVCSKCQGRLGHSDIGLLINIHDSVIRASFLKEIWR